MTSRAGVGEVGGAGVGATPSLPGWINSIYKNFRILVLSEDSSRLDFVASGFLTFGYSDPSPGSVAELMTITGMNTLTIGNYMRKTRESRAGAAGAGPSVAQPPMQPSYLEQLAQVEAGTSGPSVAQPPMQPSHLEQLAQVEAGTSVAQPSSVFGARTTNEGNVSFSDLDLFLDFTEH